MTPVHTSHETQRPRIYVEMTDGNVDLVQFRAVDDAAHDDFVVSLQHALSTVLQEHTAAFTTQTLQRYALPPDPHHDDVMAFVEEQLEAAPVEALPNGRTWFPVQADGRDATGAVHISVANAQVVILDIEPGVLREPRDAGRAIVEAINLALHRHRDDVATYITRRTRAEPSDQESPDWASLALRVRRCRLGY